MDKKYIGHLSQVCGVQEMRAVGGRADGMRLLVIRNGIGLDFTVSLDRCADLPYLYYKGNSMAYIAPCGLVAPQYYDSEGTGFLKSFTAGFLTTCGLTAVGSPCVDDGESLPLHGNISHVPCEQHSYSVDADAIRVTVVIRDASLFGQQLVLTREYCCGLKENTLTITDTVKNIGCKKTPHMILYHCNLGYPLLHENAVLNISSSAIAPRDAHAAKDMDTWQKILPPSDNFTEQCYYHSFAKTPFVSLKNPDIGTELQMTFDPDTLDCFTQWKMMGEHEYVLGLEPGNCYPDGRDVMRQKGLLKFLDAGEQCTHRITFRFLDI